MMPAVRARLLPRAAGVGPAAPPPPAGWRRRAHYGFTFARLLTKKVAADGVTQRAAALAFVTILALIPLLAAFTFVAANLLHDYQDRVLSALTSVLPYSQSQVLNTLQSFVEQAESLQQYLVKGKQIYVEGRLQTRQWDDKDGNKRYTTEVKADRITLLGGGGAGMRAGGVDRDASHPPVVNEPADVPEDDIPF